MKKPLKIEAQEVPPLLLEMLAENIALSRRLLTLVIELSYPNDKARVEFEMGDYKHLVEEDRKAILERIWAERGSLDVDDLLDAPPE